MMARPPLPPRGYFIPTHMIFESQMPNAVFVTWLQLRCLTWCGQKIPPFSVQEWVDLTGTSRTTLIRHLNWLQKLHALRWHSPEPGTVSVSFEAAPHTVYTGHERCLETTGFPTMDCSKLDSSKKDCPNLDSPPSLNPHSSSWSLPNQILVLEPGNQESDQIRRNEVERGGERECEGERGLPNLNNCTHIDRPLVDANIDCPLIDTTDNIPAREPANLPTPDPVSAYRSLAHLTPNASQRGILSSEVTDLPLWQATLEHWLMHGWNPRNITGMLELYGRGGAPGCRYCQRERSPQRETSTPLQSTLAAIEAVRKKQAQPAPRE